MRTIAAALVVTCGCSFVLVKGPEPERPPGAPVTCTELPVAPVIDSGLAVLGVVGAVYAHRRLDEPAGGEFPNNDFLRMQRIFAGIGAVLFAASATYGFLKTTQCRRARAAP
jgi:hypothetical protein